MFGNEKVPKVSIEVGCQVSLVGRHVEEPAVFCVSGCPNFPNKKGSASLRCNPLFQNTTAHITTVAVDYIIWLGCQSHPAIFAFSLYFSRLSSAISAQYKSFRVELKMGTRKSHIEAKIEHLFRFLTQFFCYLIQVQHQIRKK